MARKPKPKPEPKRPARPKDTAIPRPRANGGYKLNDTLRAEIVTRLALYDPASDIVADLKAMGITISGQAIGMYNPANNIRLAPKWRNLFNETREAWAKEIMAEPIAQRAFRLRRLGQIHERAMQRGAFVVAANMLEQAAKEVGNVYSNVLRTQANAKVEHTHKIEDVSPDEKRNMLIDRLKDAMAAARKERDSAPTTH